MAQEKACSKCHVIKSLLDFSKDKTMNDGRQSQCTSCRVIYNKEWRRKNRESYLKTKSEWGKQNKKKIAKYAKDYREKNPEIRKAIQKKSKLKRKEKILAYRRIYRKRRSEQDPTFKIENTLRNRFYVAIKRGNGKKESSIKHLLGEEIIFVKKWIENQFDPFMSWTNYGHKGWHIDHIIPCSSFDLTNVEQQKKCFHYTNLQPLWAKDNLKKGSKII